MAEIILSIMGWFIDALPPLRWVGRALLDRKIEVHVSETEVGSEQIKKMMLQGIRPPYMLGAAFVLTFTNHDRRDVRRVREIYLQIRRRKLLAKSQVLAEVPVYDLLTNRQIRDIQIQPNSDSIPVIVYAVVAPTASILHDILTPTKLPVTLKLFNTSALIPIQYSPIDYLSFFQVRLS